MEKKKRVGILGGSFDPPTLGHIQMAAEAINLRYVDEVWIIPCGVRKDKQLTTDGHHRLKMTELLVRDFFAEDFPIKVNDIEIANGASIPTYHLLVKLRDDPANKDIEFYFILGSDLLDTLKYWDEAEKLIEEINFIIYIRIGYQVNPEKLPKKYIIVHTSFVASSSTEIRNRIRAHRKTMELNIEKLRLEHNETPEVGTSFPRMYEINIPQDKLSTIRKEEDGSDDKRIELEKKYLGIYGIVPLCIINYIKEHDLYNF